jgi:predicted ATPase
MRIEYFKIENFRNIAFAECDNVPNLMVICGGNGCGKSAVLNAIMAAKEHAAPYGGFQTDPRSVSANAEFARVTVRVSFSEAERVWYREKHEQDCPETDEIILEIQKGGQGRVPKRSQVVRNLLSYYSRKYKQSPGFFDYFDAHRIVQKKQLSTWDSSSLGDDAYKQSLGAIGTQKFNRIKEYLASLVMGDLQNIAASRRRGEECNPDSLHEIREFFDGFFAPMRFVDVQIDCSPFKFIIQTPKGEIDIDDLSSGEKEILTTFIHFHQLKPVSAVILFDEVDAHLHPDLERRYLELFKKMSLNNQIILTTHSPEIMVAAGSDSLYSLAKVQEEEGCNQLARVTDSDEMHGVLSEIMGTNGMVSFNKKVVFIEGMESSADRYVYEALYPPAQYNVSFIPAGDSGMNTRVSERVNLLLSSAGTFQEFYCIVDGDIARPDPPEVGRLFRLPVYHVENFLLRPELILGAMREFFLENNPYSAEQDVISELHELMLTDSHLKPFASAVFNAAVAAKANEARDMVFRRDHGNLSNLSIPEFSVVEHEARAKLESAIADGTWASVCKGRDLLKALCGKHGIKYEHFRNSLISKLEDRPPELDQIFNSIIGNLDSTLNVVVSEEPLTTEIVVSEVS